MQNGHLVTVSMSKEEENQTVNFDGYNLAVYEEIKEEYQPKGIKVAVIHMADYGMMNGKKVLEYALSL